MPLRKPETPAPQPPAGMVGTLGPLFRLIKDQRIAFLLVGATNTVIGTAWFIIFQLTVGQHFGYMASLVCAHVAAVLCAFVLYRRFVFLVHGHVWLDLARFEVVNLASLGVNAIALPIGVEVLDLAPIVAQLLITCVTMLISFFGHRHFSFHRRAAAAEPPSPSV